MIGLSDSGWMKAELFYNYIKNVFHPFLVRSKREFPVILSVGGHKTHLSLEVSELCKSLVIVLVALYPNATRLLQPADVAAFRPLKMAWKDRVLEWRRDHPLETLTKNNFVPILIRAIKRFTTIHHYMSLEPPDYIPGIPMQLTKRNVLAKVSIINDHMMTRYQ